VNWLLGYYFDRVLSIFFFSKTGGILPGIKDSGR
jgi:hypothetical protein